MAGPLYHNSVQQAAVSASGFVVLPSVAYQCSEPEGLPLTHHSQARQDSVQDFEAVVAYPLRSVVAHPLPNAEDSAVAGKALPEDYVKPVSAASLCWV